MKITRTLFPALFGALLLSGLGCSDGQGPTEPPVPAVPQQDLLGDLGGLLGGTLEGSTETLTGTVSAITGGLLSCNVRYSYSASQRIGREGGLLRVGPHSLYIPPGALSETRTISATAPAGNIVKVEFQPHGLKFDRPTVLTMSYRDCGVVNGLLLKIVYIDDDRSILEVLPSLGDIWRRQVVGKTDHFSGYALADRQGGARLE